MSKHQISNTSIIEKEFSSSTNKKNKIKLKINKLKDSIEFFGTIDSLPSKKYYLKEKEVDLLKNNYLSTGVNLTGVFKILVYYIDKNSYNILEGDNFIKLIFDIEHPIIKNVNFQLMEIKSQNEEYNELSNYVFNTLKEKVQILEEKNKNYAAKNTFLENRVTKLEHLVHQLIERIK